MWRVAERHAQTSTRGPRGARAGAAAALTSGGRLRGFWRVGGVAARGSTTVSEQTVVAPNAVNYAAALSARSACARWTCSLVAMSSCGALGWGGFFLLGWR